MKIIITERQNNLLKENIPVALRRRLSYSVMKNHLDYAILENWTPCEWDNIGDFVTDVCDTLVNEFLDYFSDMDELEISSKQKDDFYYFCVDTFGEDIERYYKQQCA
jgi:hypothetical protein